MIAQMSEKSRQYRVHRAPDGWRVDRGGEMVGVFAKAAEAIDLACVQARADADRGWVATVTAQTTPSELHCYVPAPTNQAAPVAPRYPRLVTATG